MADLVKATRRPRRYLMVGLVCATIHNGVMLACNSLGVQYVIALVISFTILAPTGYTLHSLFTFGRNMAPTGFVRFTVGMLAGFLINLLLMVLMVTGLKLKVPIATVLCTALLFVWNYIAARWSIVRSGLKRAKPESRAKA